MTDKELDEFIAQAEYRGSGTSYGRYGRHADTWWVNDFCEEARDIANELKQLRLIILRKGRELREYEDGSK